jgi:threonine aldolase
MFEDLKFQLSLGSDNHSGVHPEILKAMIACNRGHAHAYGLDEVSELAAKEFSRVFGAEVEAHYVFTGTAANVLAMAPLVRSYEAILASEVSHLHVDECGAPEKLLGAKIWPLASSDGKIRPEQCLPYLDRLGDQHHSQAHIVSLTQPTELGVSYSLEELRAWRDFTRTKNLMLHIDGARLANAAAHLNCSLTAMTSEIGVDVVSFGGTKNGLMGAEAVLLFTAEAKKNFKFYRKQSMQLASKSRFMAAQFYAYLKDDLYAQLAGRATNLALDLRSRLKEFSEIEVIHPVESNALFVRLPKAWIKPLREKFFFYVWDSSTQVCRWMISWDWTEELNALVIESLHEVKK